MDSFTHYLTLGAASVHQYASIYSFVFLQTTQLGTLVVTLGAAEWFITSVDPFMSFQMM